MLDFSPRWTYSPQRMHTPTQELWSCIKPLETPFTVAQGTSSSTLTSLPLIQIIFPSYFDLWIKPNLRHLSGLQMFVWVNNSLLFLFFAPWITLCAACKPRTYIMVCLLFLWWIAVRGKMEGVRRNAQGYNSDVGFRYLCSVLVRPPENGEKL